MVSTVLVLFKLTVYCSLKRIKKTSGELTFGRGETTLSWGETTVMIHPDIFVAVVPCTSRKAPT